MKVQALAPSLPLGTRLVISWIGMSVPITPNNRPPVAQQINRDHRANTERKLFDGKLSIIDRQNFPVLEKCKNLDGHRPKNQNYLKLAVVLGQKYNATVIIILYIISFNYFAGIQKRELLKCLKELFINLPMNYWCQTLAWTQK